MVNRLKIEVIKSNFTPALQDRWYIINKRLSRAQRENPNPLTKATADQFKIVISKSQKRRLSAKEKGIEDSLRPQ